MSRENDKKTVYIVSPVYGNDFGNKKIIGYENLRTEKLVCVPSSSDLDVAIYGENITDVLKFSNSKSIDINENGGDGIYFSEPEVDDDGYYQKPEYISKPLKHVGKMYQFDGKLKKY